MPQFPTPRLHQLFPVTGSRVLVIQPGTRSLKLLLAEATFAHTRILHCQTLDLDPNPNPSDPDDPAAPDDITAVIDRALPDPGPHLLTLVLPQHRTISATVDIPHEALADPDRHLEAEARKLSGLGEEALCFASTPLKPFARLRHPRFLTFCKRTEVAHLIDRFLPPPADPDTPHDPSRLTEIATTAQALFAALQSVQPTPSNALLVNLGADNTVVALWLDGQGVYATSFDGGSHQFTLAIAADLALSATDAESLKRSRDVLCPPQQSPNCRRAVEKWYAEVRRAVTEWLDDYPDIKIPLVDIPAFLSGGGAVQPGLADCLNELGSLKFHPWPISQQPQDSTPTDSFRVAYGAARIALGLVPRPISLLPSDFRRLRQHRHWWTLAQTANVLLLAAIAFALLFATVQKTYLYSRKTRLIARTQAALHSATAVAQLAQRLDLGSAAIRPLLDRQQQSLETLAAFAALRACRTNNDFWLLLFADPTSYGAGSTQPPSSTNAPNPNPNPNPDPNLRSPASSTPNLQFVAELCIPQEGDPSRRILSQVVTDLKRNALFLRVDALPPERKRNLLDPRVYITNRVYAVSLELNPHAQSVELPTFAPPTRDPKRPAPPTRATRPIPPLRTPNSEF